MTCLWQSLQVELTVTEFWIVHALARHPGHVKNRQQLMESANVVLDDNTITSHIKRIRRKFQEAIDEGFARLRPRMASAIAGREPVTRAANCCWSACCCCPCPGPAASLSAKWKVHCATARNSHCRPRHGR